MSKSEVKERTVFNKICSILIDVFIVPVILIAFICAVFMSSAKANNNVPSVMGNSIVEVLTSSMAVDGGFYPGDVLIIDQTINTDNLKVGDCIAFYAPKASGWTTTGDSSGDSLIIFHRIVRIIYANETKNGVDTGVVKKHFVCRGDAVGPLSASNGTLIPTQGKLEGAVETEWGGDYDENGNIKPGGGYVVKLVDDTTVEIDNNNVPTGSKSQSELQYVTSDYVVGAYKAKLGGFLSSVIKFCCSELGIILLVIIPSVLMLIVVATNLAQETRLARQERESGQIDIAKNISMMENIQDDDYDDNKEDNEKEVTKSADVNNIIANATEQKANEKQEPKGTAKPVQPKAVPNKKDVPSKNVDEKQTNKVEPKVAPAKAEPKAQNKPASPKKAPVKAEPKTAPTAKTEAKTTPKAPTKPEAKVAPKKVEPKVAPTKPVAPKKAPAKVPPKKD